MRCIFCDSASDPTTEHIFPETIGGTLVIDRVCKDCNSRLGTHADAPLVDHPLCWMTRASYGIGKPAAQHDPFGLGHLTPDPGQRIRVDTTGSKVDLHLIPKIEVKEDANGQRQVVARFDTRDREAALKLIARERARAGLAQLSRTELEAELDHAAVHGGADQPEIEFRLEIDLRDYRRGVLKIIYEISWYWLGDQPTSVRMS